MGRRPGITAIRDELRQIAFARVDQFVEVRDGETVLAEAPPWEDYGGAVQQIRQGTHGVEVKFYDKQRALESLLEMQQGGQRDTAGATKLRRTIEGLRKELKAGAAGGDDVE